MHIRNKNPQCLGSSRVKYTYRKYPAHWKDPHGSWQEPKKNQEKGEALRRMHVTDQIR